MEDKIIKESIRKKEKNSEVELELSLDLDDYFENRENEFDYQKNLGLEQLFIRFESMIARIGNSDNSINDRDIIKGVDSLLNGFSIEKNFQKLNIKFNTNYSGNDLKEIIRDQKDELLEYFDIEPEEKLFLPPEFQNKKAKNIIYEIMYFQSIKFLYKHKLTKNEFESVLYRVIKAICDLSFLYEKAYLDWADSFYNISNDLSKRKNIERLFEENAIKAGMDMEDIPNLLEMLKSPFSDEGF